MQELSKEDLAKGRGGRLPDRRADPARRLRLARRRGAAAGARLRQRDRHRGADLLPLAADGDLGLRHQHGLDDRDRGGDRLLALHPRPLPRGAARRAASPRRRAPQALSTSGPGGHLLRPRRDRLPGRPLDGRQPGAALDGAGGDDRRRRLDPDRDHPAAGPDRDARRPRHARRHRRQGPPSSSAVFRRRRAERPRPRGLLGALDDAGHGPPLARRDRRLRGAAHPGDPAALDRDRHPGARASSPRTATCGSATNSPRKQLGGGTDPVQIVASFDGAAPPTAPRSPASTATVEATPGVSSVAPPAFAGDSVLFQATPSAPSESDAAIALVDRLRDTVVPGHRAEPGRDRRRRRRNRPQPGRPRSRSAARCGRSSSSSSRSATSS